MKILVVGGNQIKYFGRRYYAYAEKLCNGFIRNNHTVIRFYDRDSARLDNIFRSRRFGVKGSNRQLLEQAQELKPDIILFIHADVIATSTVLRLREILPAAKFAQISMDALFISRNIASINSKNEAVDVTFVTTAGECLKTITGGKKACYIPNPVDASIEAGRAFENECDIDLICACGSFDQAGVDPRKVVLDLVGERMPDIRFARRVRAENGGLWGDEYMTALSRSKCGLNLSRDREGPHNVATPAELNTYSSDRVSHLTGNGVLAFTERKFGLDRLFADDEMVFYDNNEELLQKIRHYLDNDDERRLMAGKGWEKAHREMNERLVAQYVAEVLFDESFSHDYIWLTEKVA